MNSLILTVACLYLGAQPLTAPAPTAGLKEFVLPAPVRDAFAMQPGIARVVTEDGQLDCDAYRIAALTETTTAFVDLTAYKNAWPIPESNVQVNWSGANQPVPFQEIGPLPR
jgi:hypothetical protein